MFQHMLYKIIFQAKEGETCKTPSEISLQSPREGIERSKLSGAMFDSSYSVVLWTRRKKQGDLRVLTMVVAGD